LLFVVACMVVLGLGLGAASFLCMSYKHTIAVLEARAAEPHTAAGYEAVAIRVAWKALSEEPSLADGMKFLGNYVVTVSGTEAECTVTFTPLHLPGDLTVGEGSALGVYRSYIVNASKGVLLRELPRQA
jgi:hypothetical protein